MSEKNSIVAVFESHNQADEAVRELQRSGLHVAKLPIIDGDCRTDGLSTLGAALASIGIPQNSILKYDASLNAGKFLLILHATPEEAQRAKDRLDDTQAAETTIHAEPAAVGV